MLSKESEKILKELKKQEKEYREKEFKDSESIKLSYDEIKSLFPDYSFVFVTMLLKYLLEERYIYNHIDGNEHGFAIEHLENGLAKFVIGEKGVSYLGHKKYRLFAVTVPLLVSISSLFISLYNLF